MEQKESKKTPIKESKTKTVSIAESEKLQKDDWVVVGIHIVDGVKVHDLKKEG